MSSTIDRAHRLGRLLAAFAFAIFYAAAARSITPEQIHDIALGEYDQKVDAIAALVASGDEAALALLQSLADGEIQTSGEQVLKIKDKTAIDLITGKAVDPIPQSLDDVVLNNRVRRELATAIAALKLGSADRAVRLAAAKELQRGAADATLPAIRRAQEHEQDPEIKGLLTLARSTNELASDDKATRIGAIRALAESRDPNTKMLLLPLIERKGAEFAEPDAEVRAEAEASLRAIDSRLATGEMIGRVFSGISLGSILLLAALCASAVVGMALERSVIRFLYGRPLETLLATWGISLILIQMTRMLFGAQNVQVENPAWMSGGVELMANVVLPYSRIVIIFFAAAVVALVALLLTRTRLGLFVRGVTQNRPMASALGVPTGRVDTYAFGLGSGIAGLAGCALSQIGNVGPDLGQSYIVDSFMVVVLGGVGQLAGTVYAAVGLGIVNKFLEAWSGAVLAKIAVLVFIIVFIQKRPQGLFALKGRMADT